MSKHGAIAWASVVLGCAMAAIAPAGSARILAIGLSGGTSHWNFMSSVARALIDRGHRLTVVAPFRHMDGCDSGRCTLVDTSAGHPARATVSVGTALTAFGPAVSFASLAVNYSRTRCDAVYDNGAVQAILETGAGAGYDVLFAEPMASECVSHAAAALRVPVVYLVPSAMVTFAELSFTGHAPNPAAASHVMSRHAVPRTFVRRLGNAVLSAYTVLSWEYHERAARRSDPRPYDSAETVKPSLVFVNSDRVVEQPRPLPPNVIPVGGIHLRPPKTVPEDVLEFIEDSPHGVIYITFGSVVTMSTLPKHIRNAFKEALAQVPQRVLWKYEDEMEDKPKNVMIKKWLPQRDILMHPNVKLFISHGGISSVYEAVDAGVPVLGFPLFYDQHRNIDNLVEAGMAISMDLMSTQKDIFLTNVLELVSNEKYTNNAKIASKIFKDRPMSPEQSVVYWTEYIIRHKGAPHLRSQALNLTWYQYFLLDVIAVMLICLFLVVFIIYKILKLLNVYVLKRLQNVKTKSE